MRPKKADMPSLSLLIGLIMSIFILGSIFYVLYQIGAADQNDTLIHFNKLVKQIKAWEDKNEDVSGTMPYFIDEYHAVVGFAKDQETVDIGQIEASYVGAEGIGGEVEVNLDCYSISKIERPKEGCKKDKGCLCLCEMKDEIVDCKKPDVICHAFDSIDFRGGAGCSKAAIIPGMYPRWGYDIRGVGALKYHKSENIVSLDDQEALSIQELSKWTEKGKEATDIFSSFHKSFSDCMKKMGNKCHCTSYVREMPKDFKIRIVRIEDSDDISITLMFKDIDMKSVRIKDAQLCSYDFSPDDGKTVKEEISFDIPSEGFYDYMIKEEIRLYKGLGKKMCFVQKPERESFQKFDKTIDQC